MILFFVVLLSRINIVVNMDKNLVDKSRTFNTWKETVLMDWIDHACLKKMKAAQHRAISLKLHWLQYFQTSHQQDDISGSTTSCSYSKKKERPILPLSNNPWIGDILRKVNHSAQLCRYCGVDSHVHFNIFQSNWYYQRMTGTCCLSTNERSLSLRLAFKKNNKLGLAKKNADLAVSNLPFTTPKI